MQLPETSRARGALGDSTKRGAGWIQNWVVTGAIVDSWVEPGTAGGGGSRLVLQVAPLGRPEDLMIVEAEASLVSDLGWLEDLGSNLCHGSPVAATGRRTLSGHFHASKLQLAR